MLQQQPEFFSFSQQMLDFTLQQLILFLQLGVGVHTRLQIAPQQGGGSNRFPKGESLLLPLEFGFNL